MPQILSPEIQRDIAAIARLPAVQTILRVISETTGLRFTLVARVTGDQWVACAVHDGIAFGLEAGGTLELKTTLCKKVRDTRAPVVMNEATKDIEYCNHPAPKMYGFESYISVPLYDAHGEYFGTLCGLDPKPADVDNPKVREMFKHFSELISLQLAANDQLAETQARLKHVEKTGELREQFVAVLGHDLRNPLASLSLSAETLLRKPLDAPTRKTVERMRDSAKRMTSMVSDMLDFARAKLGAGIGVDLKEEANLASTLRHVANEVMSSRTGRELTIEIASLGLVRCDAERLGQLLSNLLGNAFQHGASDRPVGLRVSSAGGELLISVQNQGAPIPRDSLSQLFEPYTRRGEGSQKGLGLGLYIVKQIADAHGGKMEVESTESSGTTFTFRMPLDPQ